MIIITASSNAQQKDNEDRSRILSTLNVFVENPVMDIATATHLLDSAGFVQKGRWGYSEFWQHPDLAPLVKTVDYEGKFEDWNFIPVPWILWRHGVKGIIFIKDAEDSLHLSTLSVPPSYTADVSFLLSKAGFIFQKSYVEPPEPNLDHTPHQEPILIIEGLDRNRNSRCSIWVLQQLTIVQF